jgi:hypothetical protein
MAALTRTQGTVVTTRCVFTNAPQSASPGPADPGTVECKVERPNEDDTTYTYPASIVRDGVGIYHLDIITSYTDADDIGTWTCEWRGSGTGPNVVGAGIFVIDSTAID